MSIALPRDILDFWFAAGPSKWFAKDASFDAEIRKRFDETHVTAGGGRLDGWMKDAQGALALLIVLDQFSRNLYRDDHRAWVNDGKALAIAREAISRRLDVEVPVTARQWFYLPFMHAEDGATQEESLRYHATRLEDAEVLRFAEIHADIIKRFGRFPHRNAALGRASTPEEESFLSGGGFAG